MFDRACKLDLEGIVAKHKFAPYVSAREHSTRFKIRNPRYSQWEGREELIGTANRCRAGIRVSLHARKLLSLRMGFAFRRS